MTTYRGTKAERRRAPGWVTYNQQTDFKCIPVFNYRATYTYCLLVTHMLRMQPLARELIPPLKQRADCKCKRWPCLQPDVCVMVSGPPKLSAVSTPPHWKPWFLKSLKCSSSGGQVGEALMLVPLLSGGCVRPKVCS